MVWALPALVALAYLLLSAGAVSAQEPLAKDPTGDVRLEASGQEAGSAPEGRLQHLDLTGLTAVETADAVVWTVQVADIQQHVSFVEDSAYWVHFTHNDQPFRLAIYLFDGVDGKQHYARLDRQSAEDEEWNPVRWHMVDLDESAATMSVEVYREDLRDQQGAAPYPGRSLEQIHVASQLGLSDGFTINVNGERIGYPLDARDRMPDEGPSLSVLEFEQGLRQTGHAVLWTDRPMRASNGEASTFVFTLTAQNTADETDTFELVTKELPVGWYVSLPDQVVQLDAGETRKLPVILSTPFSHQHGSAQDFLVTMTSRDDPQSVGRAILGIYYHETPQPAGHHDEVWFHSGRYWEGTMADIVEEATTYGPIYTYFNTLEDDPNDERLDVSGNFRGYGTFDGGTTPVARWEWYTYISPSLSMGLDFDLTRGGTVTAPIKVEAPFPQTTVSGALWHWAYEEETGEYTSTEVAAFDPQGPTDLLPGTHTYTWEWRPVPDADLLPFADRQGLTFLVRLETPAPHLFTGAEAPLLAPGGSAKLPLLEYRDPVQDQYEAQTVLHFRAPAAAQANPGTTRVLEGSLHNADPEPYRYRIHVEGVNAAWARLLVPDTGTLESDGTLEVRLAVDVPPDALDQEAADLVVSVADREDPTTRALGRFFVAVDTSQELPDDAAGAQKVAQEEAGAALLVPAVAALALLAAARRR